MSSNERIETSAVRLIPITVRIALCLLATLMLAAANLAQATPVTPPGFLDDAGDSYFTPGATTFGVELLDTFSPASEFGFFYRSDPGTPVTIFDGGDISLPGPASQFAAIDFSAGMVFDLDTPVAPDPFAVLADDIGFYFAIPSIALTIYSDPTLNVAFGGFDAFYAFQSIASPMDWALYFEADLGGPSLETISINFVTPLTAISAVPVPAAVWLFGTALIGFVGMSRRRKVA